MAKQKRRLFRQLRTLLGFLLNLGLILTALDVRANPFTCESSHLSAPAANLEEIAENLAKLRLFTYKILDVKEKSRADQEFQIKYAEFAALAGDHTQAQRIFQKQMRNVKQAAQTFSPKELKPDEQREREKQSINPIMLAKKMVFHEIRPGKFKMRSKDQTEIEISEGFEMMNTQVTQLMWARIKAALGEKDPKKVNPSRAKTGYGATTVSLNGVEVELLPDHPVEYVGWVEVMSWIEGLNTLSNSNDADTQAYLQWLIPDHQKGDIYDLPTAAQWNFVFRNRGQATGRYFDRDDSKESHEYAWLKQNSEGKTHAVATLKPRLIDGKPFYDMGGNVSELAKDPFESEKIPLSKNFHLLCGTSYIGYPIDLFYSIQNIVGPSIRSGFTGFRLIRTRP